MQLHHELSANASSPIYGAKLAKSNFELLFTCDKALTLQQAILDQALPKADLKSAGQMTHFSYRHWHLVRHQRLKKSIATDQADPFSRTTREKQNGRKEFRTVALKNITSPRRLTRAAFTKD